MRPVIIWLFVVIVFPVRGSVYFEMNSNCTAAYTEILALNFIDAEHLLIEESRRNKGNMAVSYVRNYMDFLKAFISEEETDFNRLKKNTDQRIALIETLPDNNPWKKYAKAEMLLHLSVVKLKWKEFLSAGYNIRKSYKLLEENKKAHPDFTLNLKSLGFFHAAIGSVPQNYKWLANLAGMKGTIREGSGELTQLALYTREQEALKYLRDEVTFLRIIVAMNFEKDNQKALQLSEKLHQTQLPYGSLHTFMRTGIQMHEGRFDKAEEILKSHKPNLHSYPLHYLNYMHGVIKLNNLDTSASVYFTHYVKNFKGGTFVKSANQKLAWVCLLKNDLNGYRHHIMNILKSGNDFTDEDKQAQKEAETLIIPNISLLKARLLFDGSHYSESLDILVKAPAGSFNSLQNKIEYTYRLARIFDKLQETAKAKKYYQLTYENGNAHPWYFAANSALLLGNMYESENDTARAVTWYKKCLSLRNHEYQNSIDQKAEAGLGRMKKN